MSQLPVTAPDRQQQLPLLSSLRSIPIGMISCSHVAISVTLASAIILSKIYANLMMVLVNHSCARIITSEDLYMRFLIFS